MELYIAGGCSEHGRNCFLVTAGEISFLIDAGIMKEKPELPYPELDAGTIGKLSCVFLTHSHADHTGAVKWLIAKSFHGRIAASRRTLEILPDFAAETVCIEELADPLTEAELPGGISMLWGRSGHSVGSVWYRFRDGEHSVLFSGDYEEQSCAYQCDPIRGMDADAAVLDCAYGFEKEGASEHLRVISDALDRAVSEKHPLLFPVPSHGRGLDVIRLLAARKIPFFLEREVQAEYSEPRENDFWLRREFLDAVTSADIRLFETAHPDEIEYPDGETVGILVRDSQLFRPENRRFAERVIREGGRVILTGKQDPASFARTLLDRGDADFFRISVHQNAEEMLRLASANSFRRIIPYHCRQKLSFQDPSIMVTEPGDRILIG